MTDVPSSPVPYRVHYSQRVLDDLNLQIASTKDRIKLTELELAVGLLDYRLRIYPQFGQPLRDLNETPLQVWIGCIRPLVVHYILDEERKSVTVVRRIQVLQETKAR
jgi:hypothetical protein